MHNCDHIKELLLTDYTDGRLDKAAFMQVEAHLEECSSCRQMAQEIKEQLRYPLQQAVHHEPSQDVWLSIREKIAAKTDAEISLSDRIIDWIGRLNFPRLIPVFGSFAVALVLVSSVLVAQFNRQMPLDETDSQDESQILLLTSVSADMLSDRETPIERYFL